MSRNFGLGSRDMGTAGQYALNNSARDGAVSFCTAATNGDRWESFAAWAKDEGVKKMENVTPELVKEYGQELAEKVKNGEMAASTAQNYVSAVNSVMNIATNNEWKSVSPTKDCGIDQRSHVREDAPGALDRDASARARAIGSSRRRASASALAAASSASKRSKIGRAAGSIATMRATIRCARLICPRKAGLIRRWVPPIGIVPSFQGAQGCDSTALDRVDAPSPACCHCIGMFDAFDKQTCRQLF